MAHGRNRTDHAPEQAQAEKQARRLKAVQQPLFLWATVVGQHIGAAGVLEAEHDAPGPGAKDAYRVLLTQRWSNAPLVLVGHPDGEPRPLQEFITLAAWLMKTQFAAGIRARYGAEAPDVDAVEWVQHRNGRCWRYTDLDVEEGWASVGPIEDIGGIQVLKARLSPETGYTLGEQKVRLPATWFSVFMGAGLLHYMGETFVNAGPDQAKAVWNF
ncbi:hypothetical protein [Thiomonas sp.]